MRVPSAFSRWPNFREFLTCEVRRIPLLGTSVNKGKEKSRTIRQSGSSTVEPGCLRRQQRTDGPLSSSLPSYVAMIHTSVSGRALLTVPSYGLPYGLPERRSVVAEGSREGRVIHNERLFELVEHLDYLALRRIKES